jgi:hypothetical protein
MAVESRYRAGYRHAVFEVVIQVVYYSKQLTPNSTIRL